MKVIKKNKIITVLILILIIILAVLALNYFKNKNRIENKIKSYIEQNCTDVSKCNVDVSNFTKFNWDTFCYVDSGASLNQNINQIPATLPANYSLSDPKLIFIQNNKIVFFEEIPIGTLENIPSHTVLFEKNGCYTDHNSNFKVKIIDNGLKGVYSLYKD